MNRKRSSEKSVRDIRRATRKHYSREEKIRIVLDGLRGEESIAELCAVKESTPTCITAGPGNSSKPARSVWLATRHGRRLMGDNP